MITSIETFETTTEDASWEYTVAVLRGHWFDQDFGLALKRVSVSFNKGGTWIDVPVSALSVDHIAVLEDDAFEKIDAEAREHIPVSFYQEAL